jgi:hypothetical protein
MDAEEREIYYFLKSWKTQFISAREICRRAGGKKRFQQSQEWAKPFLIRMVDRGILETDNSGHYRIRPPREKGGMKRWVSPEIASILKRGGTGTSELVITDAELDEYYDKL